MSADLVRVLAEHYEYNWEPDRESWECQCGHLLGEDVFRRDADPNHRAHQAAVLSAAGFGPVKEAAAAALREAADDMDEVIACGDVAEVAAPVEGSVGRPEAIRSRDSLYEEPSHWLRGYADAVEDEAARAAAVRGEA